MISLRLYLSSSNLFTDACILIKYLLTSSSSSLLTLLSRLIPQIFHRMWYFSGFCLNLFMVNNICRVVLRNNYCYSGRENCNSMQFFSYILTEPKTQNGLDNCEVFISKHLFRNTSLIICIIVKS